MLFNTLARILPPMVGRCLPAMFACVFTTWCEHVSGWMCLDDSDGYASGFFEDLEPAWTEAILSADLTPAEREQWAQKLA